MEQPKVGDKINGYIYNGGDPSDERSWAKDQEVSLIKDTERTPHVSVTERAKIKNFGTVKDTANYLKKVDPELDVVTDDDMVYVRRKGEKEYKALDPKGFDKEDILDIGSDVVGGGLEALSAYGAGVGSGGFLAVPAAVATGSAVEGVKQRIGKSLGVREDINAGDIALSGAIGGAFPAASALVAPVKRGANVFKNYLLKKGSGLSDEVVDTYIKNIDELENLDIGKRAEFVGKSTVAKSDAPRQAISKEYDIVKDLSDKNNIKENMLPVVEDKSKELTELYAKDFESGSQLEKALENVFNPKVKIDGEIKRVPINKELSARELVVLREKIDNTIDGFIDSKTKFLKETLTPQEKNYANHLKNIREEVVGRIDSIGGKLGHSNLSGRYRDASEGVKEVKKGFEDKFEVIERSTDLGKDNKATQQIKDALESSMPSKDVKRLKNQLDKIDAARSFSIDPTYSKNLPKGNALSNLIATGAQGLIYGGGGKASSALAGRTFGKEMSAEVLKDKTSIRNLARSIARSPQEEKELIKLFSTGSRFAPSLMNIATEEE